MAEEGGEGFEEEEEEDCEETLLSSFVMLRELREEIFEEENSWTSFMASPRK